MSNWGEVSKYSTVVEQSCDTLAFLTSIFAPTFSSRFGWRCRRVAGLLHLHFVGVNWEWFSITINRQANVQNIAQEATVVVWLQHCGREGRSVGRWPTTAAAVALNTAPSVVSCVLIRMQIAHFTDCWLHYINVHSILAVDHLHIIQPTPVVVACLSSVWRSDHRLLLSRVATLAYNK